jgi:hypothetical protein
LHTKNKDDKYLEDTARPPRQETKEEGMLLQTKEFCPQHTYFEAAGARLFYGQAKVEPVTCIVEHHHEATRCKWRPFYNMAAMLQIWRSFYKYGGQFTI